MVGAHKVLVLFQFIPYFRYDDAEEIYQIEVSERKRAS
jgi:hypothetical protein